LKVRVLPGLLELQKGPDRKNFMIAKVQNFVGQVLAEMKKVSWSTRRELLDSTLIVIFASLILGVFVASVDFVYSKGVTIIFK
jgi:preprotein translocase subunit SecE